MWIKKYLAVILIFAVFIALFISNYVPGTYLTGWDSLQTELAPGLAIKRAFFSVWEEYQSLGLVAGMAHGADLIRAIIIWLMSLVLPQSLIRYAFHLSMVLVAGLGMHKLLIFSGFNKQNKVFAFLGTLFYMLNFAAIQMLFLPFEPFTIFFGMLPWEAWVFLRIIEKQNLSRKDLLLFILVNILATPQAVAQQVFVVYMLLLGLLTAGLLMQTRRLNIIKNAALSFLLIVIINSFWILPQLYFLKTSGYVVRESKINQLATEDLFYTNKDKGNIRDFFTFTGFFYDALDKNHQPLFKDWKTHREAPVTLVIIFTLSVIWILGLFNKSRYRVSFLLALILVMVGLLINAPPIDQLNQLIRNNSFINQIFRTPFTKFSIVYALVSSYLFASGAHLLSKRLSSFLIVPVILGGLIIFQALPAFQGNYISHEMQVKIPQEYFDAITYFNGVDKNKRIALLPEYTFWGWFYNRWGYNGSGFLWYGIEQPIMSRTFDVWSLPSEAYFWEAKTALEAENVTAFENVLEKYNVDYLLFDHSLLPVVATTKTIQYDQIEELLKESKKISLAKKWGFLAVYKVAHPKKINNFVAAATSLPNIGPAVKITNDDTAYQANGDYITTTDEPYSLYYPFLDLTTQTHLANPQWKLIESNTDWSLVRQLPPQLQDYLLSTPSGSLDVNLYTSQTDVRFVFPYSIGLQKNLVVQFPKMQIDSFIPNNTNVNYCIAKKGRLQWKKQTDSLLIDSKNGAIGCFGYEDAYLDQRYGYIIRVISQNLQGQPLFFYVLDKTKDQPYIEDRLQNGINYYILGYKFRHGLGYTFSFQNNSYTTISSSNQLTSMAVYLMPYDVLKQLMLINNKDLTKKSVWQNNIEAKKLSYYRYAATVNFVKNQPVSVMLYQAYNPGWKAYQIQNSKFKIQSFFNQTFPFLFGSELKNHILVNNWANGWKIDETANSIIIIFLPQYLEYLGFLLLALTLASIPAHALYNRRKKAKT